MTKSQIFPHSTHSKHSHTTNTNTNTCPRIRFVLFSSQKPFAIIASARFLINFYGALVGYSKCLSKCFAQLWLEWRFKCTLELCITYLCGRTTACHLLPFINLCPLMIASHRNGCNRFFRLCTALSSLAVEICLCRVDSFSVFFSHFFFPSKEFVYRFSILFAFPSTSFALVKLNGCIINPLKGIVIVIKFIKIGWIYCYSKWIFQRFDFVCGRTKRWKMPKILIENACIILGLNVIWFCLYACVENVWFNLLMAQCGMSQILGSDMKIG